MGYSGKAIRGVGWTGFLQVALKGVSLIKFIVIAKFLSPLEFGIFGIALLTIGFFQSMTETGVNAYLVQSQESEEENISSAWLVSIIRGFLLFILTILFAYPISLFFNSESAFFIILVAGLIPLINGLENPSLAKFQRYLDFDKEFYFRVLITVFDLIISVALIFYFKNSLGLIVAMVFTACFQTCMSFVLISPKPKFIYEIKKIKKIFHFGKWLTLISGINYFVEQADSIVVGRILGIESLGIYEMAQKFSLQIMIDGGNVFTKITFPLFSRIKTDNERTKRALIKILFFVSLFFGFITIILFIFSKEILILFSGSKWLSANIPLKLFSLTGLITALMAIITSLFLARARQDITAKIISLRLLVLVVLIVPASSYFGIIGASTASLLSFVVVLPLAITGIRQIFKNK